jgi:hypothetical protein
MGGLYAKLSRFRPGAGEKCSSPTPRPRVLEKLILVGRKEDPSVQLIA